MKKVSVLGLFVVLGLVILTGCGANPNIALDAIDPASLATPADGTPVQLLPGTNQKISLTSRGTGSNGEDEVFTMTALVSYDTETGTATANVSGAGLIVNVVSGGFQSYPIQPGDWLADKDIYGRVNVTIHLEGGFVGLNGLEGSLNPQVDGIPLNQGGSGSINLDNLLDGDRPDLFCNWGCNTQYNRDGSDDRGWGSANCSSYVSGGNFISSYLSVGEVIPGKRWYADVNLEAIITGKMNAPIADGIEGGGGKG